ncbi:haloalkane dehalogenase [Roseobacter sp. YSTF-M11]|uniref:Haloalkane dehalogenase n=1 Tax=Roseobacter insulae TaxID=2859783 RepID=A0A9X1K2R1_9RHOB|nr:haloalkane dehalogenase [Roseobacter insulae]MBW4710534.1 haloalkane dehalogenase [Roseobacter insulae]
MRALRTPDARFADLSDFPFEPRYLSIDDTLGGALRMHYLDEGPGGVGPILALHGEPTWSYLYRHMIPVFTAAGHRVVAPDLIGFGRSDKPAAREDYTYQRHVEWMSDALEQMDLHDVTMVCQDWGGLIGLRVLAAMPHRFSRMVLANTALPTGDHSMGSAFENWREYSQSVPEFRAGRIVHGGTVTKLTEAEVAAYDAPFPDETYQAGARAFPMLVPDQPDDPASAANRAAWEILRGLELPVLTVFGAEDRIMAGIDKVFQKEFPGAAGQPHKVLPGAGHFLQEDVGLELAQLVNEFIAQS